MAKVRSSGITKGFSEKRYWEYAKRAKKAEAQLKAARTRYQKADILAHGQLADYYQKEFESAARRLDKAQQEWNEVVPEFWRLRTIFNEIARKKSKGQETEDMPF